MIRAEFTIYPFREGDALPPYVQVAVDAIRAAGLDIAVGPLSSTVIGPTRQVLEVLGTALSASMEQGASRIAVNIESTT